jgi:hypothetical protein
VVYIFRRKDTVRVEETSFYKVPTLEAEDVKKITGLNKNKRLMGALMGLMNGTFFGYPPEKYGYTDLLK